jgi:cytochrome P450
MLNSRMYIISSPAIASQVQRSSATLSFEQLVIEVTPRMVGTSAEANRMFNDAKAKEEGRERMATQVTREVIHPNLSLNKMDIIGNNQLRHFTDFIGSLHNGDEVDLYKLVTSEITMASMDTFYGPENPFAMHSDFIEQFFKWENGVIVYMMGILPQWTAREAHIALEKMVKGYIEYVEKGRQHKASQLIRDRWQAHVDVGFNIEDMARFEVAMAMAFNVNAGITLFWTLNNIYSRPELLAELREEVHKNALVSPGTISYTALRESCPLLNSVYKESMRLIAPMTSARYVLADTIVADTYLLKKDTVVQIAGGVLHADQEIWGPDADSFNPHRFLYTPNGTKSNADGTITNSKSSAVHPAAFRGFGGGSSLCPGRHFAQMEITTLTAAFITGWDFEAPEGQTEVKWNPPKDEKRFPFAVVKPLEELSVKVKRRRSMEDVDWVLQY